VNRDTVVPTVLTASGSSRMDAHGCLTTKKPTLKTISK
jgi:hypothetical protein